MRGINAVKLGWLAGWGAIGITVITTVVAFVAAFNQIELPSQYIDPIQTFIYDILFILFLLGIRGFAMSRSDTDMIKTTNTLVIISVLEILILSPMTFPNYFEVSLLYLLLVAVLPLICINGIVLVRLSQQFVKYTEELGTLGKRVVWWTKVGGWMEASVILLIPGLFACVVSEFFLWRLLAKEAKK